MRTCEFDSYALTVSRTAALLDTNVVFAAFFERDKWHEQARVFIDQPELCDATLNQMIVPSAVVIETWGLLVGRQNRRDLAEAFLDWLITGRVSCVAEPEEVLNPAYDLSKRAEIDVVDAVLFTLGGLLARKIGPRSSLRIVTFDTKDYWKSYQLLNTPLELLDLKSA